MLKSLKGRKFSFIVLNILNLCCLHVCRKYHLLSRERVQPFIDAEEKVNKVPGVSQIHQAFSTKERWKNSGFKNQTNLKGKASCTWSGLLLQAVPGEGLAKLRAQGLFVNIFCQSVNWNLLPFLQEYVEEPKEIQFSFKEVVKFEKNNVWIVSHQNRLFLGWTWADLQHLLWLLKMARWSQIYCNLQVLGSTAYFTWFRCSRIHINVSWHWGAFMHWRQRTGSL